MKDTARKRDRSQDTPHIGQLALGAMFEARATLYETVVHAGMGVLAAMLEEDRTRLCGRRYEHDRDRPGHARRPHRGRAALRGPSHPRAPSARSRQRRT
jgi:hypothetical protein